MTILKDLSFVPETRFPNNDFYHTYRLDLDNYLRAVKSRVSPSHQMNYARSWLRSLEWVRIFQEKSKRPLNKYNLVEQPGLVPQITDDNLLFTAVPPIRVFADKKLPYRLLGHNTEELLGLWVDTATYHFCGGLPFYLQELGDIFSLPTPQSPMFMCFITDNTFSHLFPENRGAWVFSGPILWITEKGLRGLSSPLKIDANLYHEIWEHFLLQQSLKSGRRAMLNLEVAVLEGMGNGHWSKGQIWDERIRGTAKEMMEVQTDTDATFELINTHPKSHVIIDEPFTREKYLLARIFMEGFYQFVSQGHVPVFHQTDEVSHGWKKFYREQENHDFVAWRNKNGWKEYRKWWDTKGRNGYLINALMLKIDTPTLVEKVLRKNVDGWDKHVPAIVAWFKKHHIDITAWKDWNRFAKKVNQALSSVDPEDFDSNFLGDHLYIKNPHTTRGSEMVDFSAKYLTPNPASDINSLIRQSFTIQPK